MMNVLVDRANKKALEYFRRNTDGKGLNHNALAFAIGALEKQVPKRIVDDYSETVCPCCKANFFIDDLNVVMKYDYCPDCGQKLEWH